MPRIAEFMKVSFNEFEKAWKKTFPSTSDAEIKQIYESIKIPQRATTGSAGYDFYTPISATLAPKENFLVPTGIRVRIDEGWFLAMMPRSGLGFKFRLQLDNTIGVIDSDYFNSDNEGHIFVKITNDNNQGKILELAKDMAICQGVFLPYGITIDDNVSNIRNGGLGSTSK